jgi:hypothetical protein
MQYKYSARYMLLAEHGHATLAPESAEGNAEHAWVVLQIDVLLLLGATRYCKVSIK